MTSPPSKPPASRQPPLFEGEGVGSRRWTGEYVVARDKLLGYLLDTEHVRGGAKASFFLGQGFSRDEPERLAGALIALVSQASLARVVEDEHGLKFVYEGFIETPSGKRPFVRAVWRVRRDDPRHAYLTTAYPRRPPAA